jgi:2,3-bisphosphoglycerate-dependent phosphoglycerate mutase
MVQLVLVRHGQSTANLANEYTGWNDVSLTDYGRQQAAIAGKKIAALADFAPTCVHTSLLSRAILTADIIMDVCQQSYLPLYKTWRLNERHYGALRGLNKNASRTVFGSQQVLAWRRGFDAVPPKLGSPAIDRRYAQLDPHLLPRAESLHDTQRRVLPYYFDQIARRLRAGEDQLVVAHGSSLRALIKFLEAISDQDIIHLEVLNAEPIVYRFSADLKIVNKEILKA